MLGIDTYFEALTFIGGLFLAWFFLVLLFAPHIPYKLQTALDCASVDFIYSLRNATLASVRHDSRFEILTNADEFYPAMLEAIAGARQSVHMECYIFGADETGRRFMDALMERSRAGVVVKLTVDALGSGKLSRSGIGEMRSAGCRVERYQPLRWYLLARLNNRTHRELLVVDGRVAFIGGAGVGDQWEKGERGKRPWRDTVARVTGPAVSGVQGVFAENWLECCGEILTGPESFPELEKTGNTASMVVKRSPGDRATATRVAFQMLIESATKVIRINAPYFTAGQVPAWGVHPQRAAWREDRDRGARLAYRPAMGAARQPAQLHPAARGRHPPLRVPSGDDARKGAERG